MRFRVMSKLPREESASLYTIKPIVRASHWFSDIKKQVSADHDQVCIDIRHIESKYVLPIACAFFRHHFVMGKYKTDKTRIKNIIIIVVKDAQTVEFLKHHLKSQWFGNRLASEPANKLYPALFCKAVVDKFQGIPNVKINIWDEIKLKKRGFGLVLAVGNSSVKNPPRFMILKINPPQAKRTIVVIGKGVVFDSGGYNLKTSAGMQHMNGDKTGGALAVALAQYFAIDAPHKLPKDTRLVVLVPLVENLIGQTAQRVGDIHKAYNGLTVEVLNTDAEGRLIMADALAFASHVYKPDLMLDFATLTGWSQTLHCDTSYVYYTENDSLAQQITSCGLKAGERSIRLPPWPEYMENVKSEIADLKNAKFTSCEKGGGFMATMFLAHFVKNRNNWVHFDLTHVTNAHGMSTCNGLQTAIGLVEDF